MQTRDTGQRPYALTIWRVLIATAWICGCSNLIGQSEVVPVQPQAEFMVKVWTVGEGLPHP